MAIDLYKEYGIMPDKSEKPIDLYAEYNSKLNPLEQIKKDVLNRQSQSERMGKDVLAGLGNFAINLANSPYNIANALASHGIINEKTANAIPRTSKYDFNKILGINEPSLKDKLIQGAAQYAPYGIGGEALLGAKLLSQGIPEASLGARLANQALSGGAFGLTQEKSPFAGATLGAITAPVGELGIGAIKGGVSHLGKYAASGLNQSIGKSLENIKNLTNQEAFDKAYANYLNKKATENALWEQLPYQSALVDLTGTKFNNNSYKEELAKVYRDLFNKSSQQPAEKRYNETSLSLLDDYINKSKHNTFTSALQHYKSLNRDFENEQVLGKSQPFNTVNLARKKMKETIQNNISNNGLNDTIGELWNAANKATQEKNQLFHDLIGQTGKNKHSSFLAYTKNVNPYAEKGNFIYDYTPKSRAEGTARMQQFINMIGNEQEGKDYLKHAYFSDALKTKGIDTNEFLNKYNKLSNEQQKILFNKDEIKDINALNNILEKNPKALEKDHYAQSIMKHVIPIGIGGAVGSIYHQPILGAMAGSALNPALHASMEGIFSKPSIQRFYTNYFTGGKSPVSEMLANSLRRGLPATLLPAEEQIINKND